MKLFARIRPALLVLSITLGLTLAAFVSTHAQTRSTGLATPAGGLAELGHNMSLVKSMKYTAVVSGGSQGRAAYVVTGYIVRPDKVHVTVAKSGKQVAEFVSNGHSFIAFSPRTRHYVIGTATADSYIGDSDAFPPFATREVGDGPVTAMFLPMKLLISAKYDLGMPAPVKGITHRLTATQQETTIDGHPGVKIVQLGTLSAPDGSSSAVEQEVDYTKSPWSLRRLVIRKGDTPASLQLDVQVDFTRLTLNPGPGAIPAGEFRITPSAGATAYVPPVGSPNIGHALASGSPAPDFPAQTVRGKTVKLSDYRGRVVVLDLWATWCGPCMMALPHTNRIAARAIPRGVVFLPVCVLDTRSRFVQWVHHHKGLAMRFLYDPAGNDPHSVLAQKYNPDATLPAQFVIGKHGKVAATFMGLYNGDMSETALQRAIDRALAQK